MRLVDYNVDFLSTPAYDRWIEEDFEAFMGGGRTTKSTTVKVLDSIDGVLDGANDSAPTRRTPSA